MTKNKKGESVKLSTSKTKKDSPKKSTKENKEKVSTISSKKTKTNKELINNVKSKIATKKMDTPVKKKKVVTKKATKKTADTIIKKKPAAKKVAKTITEKKTIAKKVPKATKEKKVIVKKTPKVVTKKKTIVKKTPKTTTKKKAVTKKTFNLEYYDLPYRYNETTVKLLAQSPKILFVYWDISDIDRKNLINKYGEDIFNTTKPFLIIFNETKNYTFEIEISDYANSWYLNVDDESCNYKITLIRKYIYNNPYVENNTIYITSSNVVETPNDHILFNNLNDYCEFINLKNGNISKILFKKGNNIYGIYKTLYPESFHHTPSSGIVIEEFKYE